MGLIDDLIQGISKEVSKVQARSQVMLKAYNLGQELKELERQRTDQLAAIGCVICEKYERQRTISEESLQQQCKEVSALEKDIALLRAQLDSLKAQNNSPPNPK